GLSEYATRVLLEAGLGAGIVKLKDGCYSNTKTAWFLLHDAVTRANLDFTQDVNYLGLDRLERALETGKPEGLKVFGDWPTLYRALAHFPPKVRESWLAFDHYYSDAAFPDALKIVFADSPKQLLDIGGNTGKWALQCLRNDPDVRVTLLDLPGQLKMAQRTLTEAGMIGRAAFHEGDLLDPSSPIPGGFSAIWMSQFLDCFSEAQIVSILKRCRAALGIAGKIYILEPFWDRQKYDAGAFSLQMTSLYFTAMANGNSRMYETGRFLELVTEAGLAVAAQHDHLGTGHTLLVCKAA
ncbi:MAG TPA: methyltransferase, partial [Verrucomicrobiae bacterium]|nr:methyltransferase [Verrucomicrobiae bacterium]